MKKIIIIVTICITGVLFHSCNLCETCVNNITLKYRLRIQYKDGDIVYYKNDTLGIRSDTIGVKIEYPNKEIYGCTGGNDGDKYKCNGYIGIYLKHIKVGTYINQAYNNERNAIFYSTISYSTKKILCIGEL